MTKRQNSTIVFPFFCILCFVLTSHQIARAEGPPLAQIRTQAGLSYGLPISWNQAEVVLLERTGRIASFEPSAIKSHSILKESFHPTTAMNLRGMLQEEFGRSYTVDGSGDFVIVASPGTVSKWTKVFADLQRSFLQYFTTRGFQINKPDFPLVGVIFRDQAEFFRYAAQNQMNVSPRTAGFYSILTNRLYLYEPSGNPLDQREAMATVRHEATHQLAFNSGLHQRLSSPPLWALEGLASIFETPGMTESRATASTTKLVNQARIDTWKGIAKYPDQLTQLFDSMVRDDSLFKSDPDKAYAIAWGVSLYLSERDSTKYARYMSKIAKLPIGQAYPSPSRVQDVHTTFPGSSAILIQSTIRYIDQISVQ
ncbi:MAG: DUF1570 domain-containing protein [Planctomycetota bacterium]|nr:DUF1570 domain-containing protein [Planctomycetota bacterium]